MKFIRGEKIHYVPCIYAGLGLICFLPSLYFFTKVIVTTLISHLETFYVQKEKMTEASPSESRYLTT